MENQKYIVKNRFYRNKYPNFNDNVVVRIEKMEDTGATVSLLEYNDIQGIVLRTQFAKKFIRSIKKVIRVGSIEVVNVLRVDENKGFIDLSKSVMTPKDCEKGIEKYEKAKLVHLIANQICERLNIDYIEFCEKFIWKLYDKYEHAYIAFRIINEDDANIIFKDFEFDDNTKKIIIEEIKKKMISPISKIRGDFEIKCFTENGIDSIKEALNIENIDNSEKIELKLVSSPQFLIQMDTRDTENGLILIKSILDKIEKKIKELGGTFKLIYEPKILSNIDKNKLEDEWNKIEENYENEKGIDEEEENEVVKNDYSY